MATPPYKTRAEAWLAHLRQGTSTHAMLTEHLRIDLAHASLDLEAIGTSESELEALRIKGCLAEARHWQRTLNPGLANYPHFLGYMNAALERGGHSIAQLNSAALEHRLAA